MHHIKQGRIHFNGKKSIMSCIQDDASNGVAHRGR
jgi:hypothetical protein